MTRIRTTSTVVRATALIALVLVLAVPLFAWAAFKPMRILAPTLNGVSCAGRVCVEYTWQEWRGCNTEDVVSESVMLRDEVRSYF